MVKSYLKYEQSRAFGLISSSSSNILWGPDSSRNATRNNATGIAMVSANEEVLCWDIKKGELLSRWRDTDCKSQATIIAQSKAEAEIFAVGYEDGSIRIWDSKIASVVVSFNGHRSAVTTLTFDASGTRLASGAKDTDVIIWDLVSEVGLFRLRGHKDQITGIEFLHPELPVEHESDESPSVLPITHESKNPHNFLLTTGKDSLIKLWDLTARHCIETHIAQSNGECWALCVSTDGNGCITAGNDGEMRVWSINVVSLYEMAQGLNQPSGLQFLRDRGVLHRQAKDNGLELYFHPRKDYFFVHGSGKALEIWRVRPEDEIRKSLARKRRRKREKLAAAAGITAIDSAEANEVSGMAEDIASVDISDVFIPYVTVRTSGKVRSASWAGTRSTNHIEVLISTTNNQLELFKIPTNNKVPKNDELPEYSRTFSVDQPGHRADIRTLTISSDDKTLASASNGGLKIWNLMTGSCIRTFECGYALCCSFLPGDKIVVIGTKGGELELFDVTSAAILDSVKAHEAAIWSLQVHPEGRSMVSGSADKSAKFWNFEVVQEEIPGTKRTLPRLKLVHTRTLKVSDEILSLKFSPDARLLAVAILDSTVKVFFTDTLKLFLNLYGHKLPVLSLDISFDSKLIVTCSADKNIRLWGLDFGDCHKAFFAHQDSILQVAFVPYNEDGNGHHFFSSSKDRVIKYWDGDKFEQIQRLDGHHGEIWALAISKTGAFIVSASHDKSIRVWEQTDEQLFLEEEKEKELEDLYENTLAVSLDNDQVQDRDENEVAPAGKQTVDTLIAGEKIIEALEVGMADHEIMKEWEQMRGTQPNIAPPPRNPIFVALGDISAEAHVLNVLQRVKAAALKDALLILPFSMLPALLTFLDIFALRSMNIPLTCRILFFMLKIHHRQIVASRTMRVMLDGIRNNLRQELARQKDEMGYNIAALRILSKQVRDNEVRDYIDEDAWTLEPNHSSQRKRGFISVS